MKIQWSDFKDLVDPLNSAELTSHQFRYLVRLLANRVRIFDDVKDKQDFLDLMEKIRGKVN